MIPRVIKKSRRQVGKSNLAVDRGLKALPPGKRLSQSKKEYYEYRKSKSDVPGHIYIDAYKRKGLKKKVRGHRRSLR